MATFRPKPAKSNDENEDSSEGLTVPTAKDAENFVSQIKKYISRGNNPQQLAMGGVSGWLTGYMAMKIGKTVATAVGGSLILLQIASYKGYININWSKVNKDIEGAQKKLLKHSSDPSVPQLLDKVQDLLTGNTYFAGGFTGGFLIGLAS